jgi:hypothetical protein
MADDAIQLLGFSFDGRGPFGRVPGPLGLIHLPWEQGTTVLFGRNGAGKTRILDRLRNVLAGFSGLTEDDEYGRLPIDLDSSFLHVRLPARAERGLSAEIWNRLMEAVNAEPHSSQWIDSDDLESLRNAAVLDNTPGDERSVRRSFAAGVLARVRIQAGPTGLAGVVVKRPCHLHGWRGS